MYYFIVFQSTLQLSLYTHLNFDALNIRGKNMLPLSNYNIILFIVIFRLLHNTEAGSFESDYKVIYNTYKFCYHYDIVYKPNTLKTINYDIFALIIFKVKGTFAPLFFIRNYTMRQR